MTKLTTSALGLLLLNPIACSGTAHVNNGDSDSGVGGASATGGSGSAMRCDIFASNPCPPNQICKQTLFPVMPPGGFGGGVSSSAYLGECVPAGQGGGSSTGGVASTGGSAGSSSTVAKGGAKATGGSTSIIYSILPPATGGRATTGGTTSIIYSIMPPATGGRALAPTSDNGEAPSTETPASEPSRIEGSRWRQKAEAALRRA